MAEPIASIRITLRDLAPLIWRQVDVPTAMNLKGLHDVIQAVMGWEDRHLYHFEIGERRYGRKLPDDSSWGRDMLDARSQRLATLVDRGVATFAYLYDYGDGWRLQLAIEGVATAEASGPYPRLRGGDRAGPPEDVGGPSGYEHYLAALADPRDPDHEHLTAWRSPFDPERFDRDAAEARLAKLAERRARGKAAADLARRSRR